MDRIDTTTLVAYEEIGVPTSRLLDKQRWKRARRIITRLIAARCDVSDCEWPDMDKDDRHELRLLSNAVARVHLKEPLW